MIDPPAPPPPAAAGPRDENLPVLSEDQAAALTAMAKVTFREFGVAVESDGRGWLRGSGWHFSLDNLSRIVAEAPWEEWPGLVVEHVGVASAARSPEREGVGRDQWLLKLRRVADLPSQPDFDSPSGLPGIAAIPAIERQSDIREMLSIDEVRSFASLDEFRDQALTNLRSLPVPEVTVLASDGSDPGAQLFALTTGDFFGAARVLVLDDLLRRTLDLEHLPHGYLVAVPNRHLILVHPLAGDAAARVIPLLVDVAETQHEDSAGPISRDVYFVSADGHAEQITQHFDNAVTVVVDGAFANVLSELGVVGFS